jgi:biotin carboxyl carrier protein
MGKDRFGMEIRSPSVGKVLRVEVEAGAEVKRGAEVIVIESMKVEIPIKSPMDGRIKEVRVKAGDHIQRNHVLAIVDA